MLLAGIWWWGSRRSGQAAGNGELRESTAGRGLKSAPPVEPYCAEPMIRTRASAPEGRDWGVPPFEPLSIRTGDYDRVPVLDGPMMVHADPLELDEATGVHELAPVLPPAAPAPARTAPAASPAPDAAQLQRIVTIRVCAVDDARWSGSQLMAALEAHGLSFGRYQVFHRKHSDGRSLFCVASLIEPGTFDIAEMPEAEFRGITLFAVLPGPIEPVETLNELFATARGLAEELSGAVQDAKGMPLSPQRAAAMREDIARFQAQLRQG